MQTWTLIDFGPDLSRPHRRATVIAESHDAAMSLAPGTCAIAFPAETPSGLPMVATSRPVWTDLA